MWLVLGHRRAVRSALLGIASCVLMVGTAAAATWGDTKYPYSVVHQNVRDVLTGFGSNTGMRIMLSPHVDGTVDGYRGNETALQFLDQITKSADLDWYFDGSVIYVSPASEEQTVIVPLHGLSFDVIKKQLAQQKLFDVKFMMSKQFGADAVILSGPPSFVTIMKQGIESYMKNGKIPLADTSQILLVMRGSQSSSITLR